MSYACDDILHEDGVRTSEFSGTLPCYDISKLKCTLVVAFCKLWGNSVQRDYTGVIINNQCGGCSTEPKTV